MGMPVNTPRTWRFGVFELDAWSGELRRNGTLVKLREQPASILLLLLEHAGQMVTREQLRHHLWPSDTFVDFDHSLNSAVMKLREALGDSADKPLYIETIPRKGYRFVAPVLEPPTRSEHPIPDKRTSLDSSDDATATGKHKYFWVLFAWSVSDGVVERPSLQSIRAKAMGRLCRLLRRRDCLGAACAHREKEDQTISALHQPPSVR
jgi:DNA-binding winged helix-turn-helix (wHTH) protein